MKVSDYIASFLAQKKCTHVFGYIGGAVTHMVDSIYRQDDVKFISTYHEQAAAFAAEGYARIKNDVGVAIATSGPGATNLITGIGSAYFDSIPCVFITGQVNTYEYKGNLELRQLGFQETDIVSIVRPITKYAVRITDPDKIRFELEKAFSIALSGRRGPVLLDVPMDIQRADVEIDDMLDYEEIPDSPAVFDPLEIIDLLKESSRPAILLGGGVRLSGATELVKEFAERLQIPVVSSLMGRDAFGNSNELYFGMIGAYGNRYANLTVANSDLVLSLGTRLDTRQTGTLTESFAREARLIRVDIDQNELSHKIKDDEIAVNLDVSVFLETMLKSNLSEFPNYEKWHKKALNYKLKYPAFNAFDPADPNFIMHKISRQTNPNDIIVLDVGQNQMWAAQSFMLQDGQRMITSGGMGAMGFSLPAAIGAYYASEGKSNIMAITGDGGMQMNIQELALLKKNDIPIKVIVMNNQSLGMIRHFQEMYFESRYNATIIDYQAPNFINIAKGYGINAVPITSKNELLGIKNLLNHSNPLLIDIKLPQYTYVHPKLSVNHPIEDQDPPLPRKEFEKNMIVKPFEPQNNHTESESFKDRVKKLFNLYKSSHDKGQPFCISIKDSMGNNNGLLRPITKDYQDTIPDCASLMSEWRNSNPDMAPSTFVSTPQSTGKWIDSIIKQDDRILFLILSSDGTKIGHIGLSSFDYEESSCEIDAVLRGEKSVSKGIMTDALNTLIYLGLENLLPKKILLRVLWDNERAVSFYIKNGFYKIYDIPLFRVSGSNGETWSEQNPDGNLIAEKYYIKMQLNTKKWKKQNSILYGSGGLADE
ncbi:MAG: hypothetical protein K0R90_314 [Oscillospiraceae bacterium]|nr:hypothetical protein [Oscillospiraceae bacterium]